MATFYPAGERPVEDLTARARILDAALAEFAARGVKGATIRGVAETAGVSVGLVQHHFGTKEGLRQACDDAVMALVERKVAAAGPEGALTDPQFIQSLFAQLTPLFPYLARMAGEGSAASSLFDALAAATLDYLTATWPERFPAGSARARDAAASMVAMSLGTYAFHAQIARHMGLETTPGVNPEFVRRVGLANVDIYTSIGELLQSAHGQQMLHAVDVASAHPLDTP